MISCEVRPAPKIVFGLLCSKSGAGPKISKMVSCFYFSMSAFFLLMSLTDPKTKWSVSGIDVYSSLFVFCAALYIPMMAFVFYYFAKAVAVIFRGQRLQDGFHPLVAAAVGVVALYSFNKWVFSELF